MTAEPPALPRPSRIRTIRDVPKYARWAYVPGDTPAKTLSRAARAVDILRVEVEAAADRAQLVVGGLEVDLRAAHADALAYRTALDGLRTDLSAARDLADILRRERDTTHAAANTAGQAAREEVDRLTGELTKAKAAIRDAAKQRADNDVEKARLIDVAKRLLVLAEATTYARLVGGLIGIVIGVGAALLVMAVA